jgi:uncharacterized protein (TIGR02145 family)
MLNKIFFGLFLIFCSFFLEKCKELAVSPQIGTTSVTDITQYSAMAKSEISNLGTGADPLQHGFVYGDKVNNIGNPYEFTTKLGAPKQIGVFTNELINLEPGTKYYLVAYVADDQQGYYGETISFTTLPTTIPLLTTTSISNITQTSATSGGNISSDGGSSVTSRGVCYSQNANPTINNLKTTDGSGIGSYVSNITGLTGNTKYYLKAFATNDLGTGYGAEVSFTTSPVLATLTTTKPSIVTTSTAVSGGNITNDGGAEVIARGVCWSTTQNPTTSNSKTTDGSGTGSFVSNLTGLAPNTTYYIRAYATNSIGTAYGDQLSFKTDPSTLTDADGNAYTTVTIGTQVWMAENLKTTKYNNGSAIPNVTDGPTWWNLTTHAYCWYDNNISYKTPYGALYNWFTVEKGNLCPAGWHVPTTDDWEVLSDFLGGELIAGGKLKEAGTTHWISPNTGATNETGFTAVPGGMHDWNKCRNMGELGLYWSATGDVGESTDCYNMLNTTAWLQSASQNKKIGYSVRCIKN